MINRRPDRDRDDEKPNIDLEGVRLFNLLDVDEAIDVDAEVIINPDAIESMIDALDESPEPRRRDD